MELPTLPLSAAEHGSGRDDERIPGVIVVFTGGAPDRRVLPLENGQLELGRRDGSPGQLDDGRVSRSHARVELDGVRWTVTDLASQNGTFVDGERVLPRAATPVHRVIRAGDTLIVPCADLRPFEHAGVRRIDGFVRGPAMQAVLAEATRAAGADATLHVRGETGSGKEGVVQAFHRAGPRAAGPLVAVNCATIPPGLAERLLFGARRGAYSGIEADATGHLQDADGGTLFLDEIGELELAVQAKLLRVLESREVVPLGGARPRKLDFALCSATHKDLRAMVAARALREDLYFRIAVPAVTVPPLRDRPEEIPALIADELARSSASLTARASLVEQCLLRPWPGNVRELLAEVRAAARAAAQDNADGRVAAAHLAATAGSLFGHAMPATPTAPTVSAAPPGDEPRRRIARDDAGWRQRLADALRASGGNKAAAARALGLHRTQLGRLMKRHGIADSAEPADDADE